MIICFSRGRRASSVSSVRWHSATNQRSAFTTVRRMAAAAPERRLALVRKRNTSVTVAANDCSADTHWSSIWPLCTVSVTSKGSSVTSACVFSHRRYHFRNMCRNCIFDNVYRYVDVSWKTVDVLKRSFSAIIWRCTCTQCTHIVCLNIQSLRLWLSCEVVSLPFVRFVICYKIIKALCFNLLSTCTYIRPMTDGNCVIRPV